MGNQLLAHYVTQCVLQLHRLNKKVVLGIKAWSRHWRLEVETEPLLNPKAFQGACTLGEIHKEHQIQHQRSGQDRVTAQEIDLDLHRVAEPSKNVNVVPTLF